MGTTVSRDYHLSNSLDTIIVGPAEACPDIEHIQLTNAREDGSEANHLRLNYTKHLWGSNYIFTVEFAHQYTDFSMRPEPGVGARSRWRL